MKRMVIFAKAVPQGLIPKKIYTKNGVNRTYYVRPYSTQSPDTRRTVQGVQALSDVKSWGKNPIADQLIAGDLHSVAFLKQLEQEAAVHMKPEMWKDPVGKGPRTLKRITQPFLLEDIQRGLDLSNSGDRNMELKLVEAYSLDYDHPGFEQRLEEIGNERLYYHGVNKGRAAASIATGLKTPKQVGSTTGQMFGPGIYFARDSDKSAQYIGFDMNRSDEVGVLLECVVALGNPLELRDANPDIDADEEGNLILKHNPEADLDTPYGEWISTQWEDPDEGLHTYSNLKELNPREVLQKLGNPKMAPMASRALKNLRKEYADRNPDEYQAATEFLKAYKGDWGWSNIHLSPLTLSTPLGMMIAGEEWLKQNRPRAHTGDFLRILRAVGQQASDQCEEHYRTAYQQKWQELKAEVKPSDAPTYHSVHARAQKYGLASDEFVVYSPNQVKIKRVLLVQRSKT